MSKINDPWQAGLASGWLVYQGASLPSQIVVDVAIIGTGAGGGISAELLAHAGLRVVMIEEGPLKTSRDFSMRENQAYPQLYQESAARKTADKAINILQGRSVGGSTTVNWTSSFRTPKDTLDYWRQHWQLPQMETSALAPWFAKAEARLNVGVWQVPPNQNNALLKLGAARLGIPAAAIQRNVKGCANLGYCGMGCPINAKQSMLVTTIPSALNQGARLLPRARATQFHFSKLGDQSQIDSLDVRLLSDDGIVESGQTVKIIAKHYVLAGGAINSPTLLLRSKAPDPHAITGKRTFLHPTLVSSAIMADVVNGFAGAPQTIYSDHFLDVEKIDGPMGYKLEAPPIHPLLFATTMAGFGARHLERMQDFSRAHALLALTRDGFHEQSPGGRVLLGKQGQGILDYPLNAYFFEAARRALLSMAEIQFAAGAKLVIPVHEHVDGFATWAQAKQGIAALDLKPLLLRVVSAHVMGGCPMSENPRLGLVNQDGRHHHINNLSIHDGSVFPTSIGANPQLSIYAQATRMSHSLVKSLTGSSPVS